MSDPLDLAADVLSAEQKDGWRCSEDLVEALRLAGLLPSRREWGVLEAGQRRMFGSESKAREYAGRNGLRVIYLWHHDWQVAD